MVRERHTRVSEEPRGEKRETRAERAKSETVFFFSFSSRVIALEHNTVRTRVTELHDLQKRETTRESQLRRIGLKERQRSSGTAMGTKEKREASP